MCFLLDLLLLCMNDYLGSVSALDHHVVLLNAGCVGLAPDSHVLTSTCEASAIETAQGVRFASAKTRLCSIIFRTQPLHNCSIERCAALCHMTARA